MQAVIIAAGESSRFWPLNRKHKSLIKIMGRALIVHLTEDLKKSGIKDIIIVQSPRKDIEKELQDKSLNYVVQKKSTGTGDSILAAKKLIKDDWFLALNAEDAKEKVSANLMRIKRAKELTLFASETKTPRLYGILKMKGGRVVEIIEKPEIARQSGLKNDNVFWLPKNFFDYLEIVPSHPFSLINALNLYAKNYLIRAIVLKKETSSLKFPWHIFQLLESRLNDLKSFREKSVKLGRNVIIRGKVFIGAGTTIGSNTVIYGPCYIGRDCRIGDNNVFRGPVNIEDRVKTGSFMEIKNSSVGSGTHFHSGYLGDSIIGVNCRVGAGFVSANRRLDRQNIFSTVKGIKINTNLIYFGTVIGDNTKIGVNISVMPGVFIGNNSVIGPGTVVFENVPDNTVFYQEFKNIISKKK